MLTTIMSCASVVFLDAGTISVTNKDDHVGDHSTHFSTLNADMKGREMCSVVPGHVWFLTSLIPNCTLMMNTRNIAWFFFVPNDVVCEYEYCKRA